MVLIAQKPCSFGGRKFFIGDKIPPELVVNPKAQEKIGVLAIVGDLPQDCLPEAALMGEEILFNIPILQKDGTMDLPINEEELQQAVKIMQMSTNEAKEAIKGLSSENVLIMLNACDSRKPVKDITETVAAKLAETGGTETEAGDE